MKESLSNPDGNNTPENAAVCKLQASKHVISESLKSFQKTGFTKDLWGHFTDLEAWNKNVFICKKSHMVLLTQLIYQNSPLLMSEHFSWSSGLTPFHISDLNTGWEYFMTFWNWTVLNLVLFLHLKMLPVLQCRFYRYRMHIRVDEWQIHVLVTPLSVPLLSAPRVHESHQLLFGAVVLDLKMKSGIHNRATATKILQTVEDLKAHVVSLFHSWQIFTSVTAVTE